MEEPEENIVPWEDSDELLDNWLERAVCKHGKSILDDCPACTAELGDV